MFSPIRSRTKKEEVENRQCQAPDCLPWTTLSWSTKHVPGTCLVCKQDAFCLWFNSLLPVPLKKKRIVNRVAAYANVDVQVDVIVNAPCSRSGPCLLPILISESAPGVMF